MPRLISDKPSATEEVKYYTLVGLPGDPRVDYDPAGTYGVDFELAGLAEGSYSLQVSACNDWQCSLPAPFDFTVPAAPLQPVGLGILF
jgi:hypothetical protein